MTLTACNIKPSKPSDSEDALWTLVTCFGLLILLSVAYPIVVVAGAACNGYVIHILWGWFVTPLCAMLVAPPWAMCAGLSLVVDRLINIHMHRPEKSPHWSHSLFTFSVYSLVVPWFVLGLGYLIHLYLGILS